MCTYFTVYDGLCGFHNYKNTVILERSPQARATSIRSFIRANSSGVLSAAGCLEIIKEGVNLGGTALNYVKARKVIYRTAGPPREAVDRLTGGAIVIAANGVVGRPPWTDDLLPRGRA
jgi:glycerol-3-phosphate dehydrogenase